MDIINAYALTTEILSTAQNGVPLVICTDAPRVIKKIESAGYREVQVNQELSKKLLEYPKEERPSLVEKELKSILNNTDPVFVTRFEMLFDPRYKIDVLKLFCDKARLINVAIKWSGLYIDGKLTYASPEDSDYHEFDCQKYQIRIVK